MSNPNTSTVASTDGTTITLDGYGDGPPLVLVGGAFQYRAFDPPTVELAQRLAGDSPCSTTTGAAAATAATPRPTRRAARSKTSEP